MRRPPLTKRVLDGLCLAITYIEAGEFPWSDDAEMRQAFDAASRWVSRMYAWRRPSVPMSFPTSGDVIVLRGGRDSLARLAKSRDPPAKK